MSRAQKPKNRKIRQINLLLEACGSAAARDTLRAALAARRASGVDADVLSCCPPGSFLEEVVMAFHRRTDIPDGLPFTAALSLLAAAVLQRNVTIRYDESVIRPAIWTIVLAASGASKTFSVRSVKGLVSDPCNPIDEIPEPVSAAAFIKSLAPEDEGGDGHNRGLWIRDEVGKFFRSISPGGPLAEMADVLLRCYDGDKLERKTKKDHFKVVDPAITFLGSTVDETFMQEVPAGALVDGFAQRFAFVHARPDQNRPMWNYHKYSLAAERDAIRAQWQRIADRIEEDAEPQFVVSKEGDEAFAHHFRALFTDEIPGSFYRRIMWRGVSYALLYHLICCIPGQEIGAVAFGWAARLCAAQIKWLSEILAGYGLSDLDRMLRAAEAVKRRIEERGECCTPRDIARGVSGVRTTQEARSLLEFIR